MWQIGEKLHRPLLMAVPLPFLVLVFAIHAFGKTDSTINPHDGSQEGCLACHTRVPAPEEAASGRLFLVGESIDATCFSCHPYDCCRINSLKGHNHPSNVNKWDVRKFTVPKSLPLHDGYITCLTCHFHLRPPGPGYKMVRMVKVKLDMVEWTALCLDCHVGY